MFKTVVRLCNCRYAMLLWCKFHGLQPQFRKTYVFILPELTTDRSIINHLCCWVLSFSRFQHGDYSAKLLSFRSYINNSANIRTCPQCGADINLWKISLFLPLFIDIDIQIFIPHCHSSCNMIAKILIILSAFVVYVIAVPYSTRRDVGGKCSD